MSNPSRSTEQILTVLKSVKPAAWSRGATITRAGKPLERSVQFYAEWMATHERPHLKQIARIADRLRPAR